MSDKIDSFYVVPKQTFFYWGFTLPKKHNIEMIKHFNLGGDHLREDITIKINNKRYPAKISMGRINNKGKSKTRSDRVHPVRDVIRVTYDGNYETLKALRKLFIYSYATTIDGTKPELKEVLEFIHEKDKHFRIKVVAKQKSDFDKMLRFMEDKNLFTFWKNEKDKKKSKENIFIDYSRKWISVNDLAKYSNRSNIIYLLYHSKLKHIYIGKANLLGDRIKKGKGREGLDDNWDKFMFFELNPDYSAFVEQIETFSIRIFSSILKNDVGIKELNDKDIKLVNRQLRKK